MSDITFLKIKKTMGTIKIITIIEIKCAAIHLQEQKNNRRAFWIVYQW